MVSPATLSACVLGGQEDHRNPVAVPAQPPHHLEAIGVRQHHVQHHQVERPLPSQAERLRTGSTGGHLEAEEPQRRRDRVPQERLVIDHQQPNGRGAGRLQQGHAPTCASSTRPVLILRRQPRRRFHRPLLTVPLIRSHLHQPSV
jgi:hypothetical protein